MFDKVVTLSQNQKVKGSNPEQVSFKELLEHLRNGDSTKEDWQLLLTCQPSAMPNLNEFENAVRLPYGNDSVATHNYDQLHVLELDQPKAQIEAIVMHVSFFVTLLRPRK